ncbi:MAG: flagellar motor switch protein FliN [Phycisphaerae bacterium]|nr:flagellar motor switch protein FliN [Phycisphaerae bacterium]
MMEAAIAEERAAARMNASSSSSGAGSAAVTAGAMALDLPDFGGGLSETDEKGISLIGDVRLDVKIELGRADMYIEDVLKLGEGAVVELDKLAGDPVDVLVNDRLVARGEVLVLNDNFCVRISEILPGAGEALEAAS